MKVIVSGSLAYDRIMNFPEYFSDHILPDKIHVLNVCFQVEGVTENLGGTAGNIAYALRLMGGTPSVSATIGSDNHRYFEWFGENGISIDGIKVVYTELTAGAYITTDKGDNQITGFNPGAMKYSSCLDFEWLDPAETIMIVAPGNLEDMIKYPLECKARRIPCIFDPGQSLPMLDPKDLLQSIDGCMILISNDYELDLIMNKTGLTKSQLLERTGTIIITLGDQGSRVCTLQGEAAGAQALSNFDTLLAPFIHYDELDYKSVKQCLQDILLAGKMVIQAGFLQRDCLGNVLHRSRVEAFLAEDQRGGCEDIITGHAHLPTERSVVKA